jgi:hypothetical protein
MIKKICDICGKAENHDASPQLWVKDVPKFLKNEMYATYDPGLPEMTGKYRTEKYIFQTTGKPGPIKQICSKCLRPIRKAREDATRDAFYKALKFTPSRIKRLTKRYSTEY